MESGNLKIDQPYRNCDSSLCQRNKHKAPNTKEPITMFFKQVASKSSSQ